jgi:hypothetical protein
MNKRTSKIPIVTAIGIVWLFSQISIAVPQGSAQGLRNRLSNELTLPDRLSQRDRLGPVVGSAKLGMESFPCSIAAQDEVWKIDGRDSHCNPGDLSLLRAERLNETDWEASSLQALVDAHATDPSKATLIYVHGDRTDDYWAERRGLQFYQNVFGSSAECRAGVRFVIWEWKSEKTQNRPCRDFPIKSCRARMVGQTLAACLAEFPDQRLVLAGYSLGCQAWLEALEQLSCTGLKLGDQCGAGYRVCLLAPALDGNYVATHLCQSCGSELVARADIFDNSADRALLCSRVVGWKTVPGGGASIQTLANQGSLPLSQIRLIDLRDQVGKRHAIFNYSSVPIFGCRLREMVDEANLSTLSAASKVEAAPTNAAALKIEVVEAVVQR